VPAGSGRRTLSLGSALRGPSEKLPRPSNDIRVVGLSLDTADITRDRLVERQFLQGARVCVHALLAGRQNWPREATFHRRLKIQRTEILRAFERVARPILSPASAPFVTGLPKKLPPRQKSAPAGLCGASSGHCVDRLGRPTVRGTALWQPGSATHQR
jgi:hypothetical protein